MNRRFSRHDFSYLISAILLIVASVSTVTGLISDLWDLNDFVYHKYAGYAVAAIGLTHVVLHWNRLVSYMDWRLKGHPRVHRSKRKSMVEPPQKTQLATEDRSPDISGVGGGLQLSRRDLIPLTLGGVLGLALGRLLRPEPLLRPGPELPYGGDIGVIYHEWSKPTLRSLLSTVTSWGSQPSLYKEYTGAQRITLPHPQGRPTLQGGPAPQGPKGLITEEAIRRRRSRRNYSDQAMTLEELSRLLYHTGGITGERWGNKLRAAPSAGALYPIETYLVIHRVEDLEPGLYHYVVQEHALELLNAADLRGEIVRHGLAQEFLGQANLVFVFTAIFQRLRWKYQERSYRYALIEAGHLGQNVYLAGNSMGLGACAVGAFADDELNSMLGVDGEEEVAVYMLAAGKV